MLPNFFLGHIFLVPLILCSSNVIISNHDDKKTINETKLPTEVLNNNTQITMINEGTILHDVPVVALPEKNITMELMALETETGKMREKPIHARKGVGSPYDIATTQNNTSANRETKIELNDTLKQQFEAALKKHKNSTAVPPVAVNKDSLPQESVRVQNTNKTEAPKKPLKVVYETLAKLEEKFDMSTKIPYVKSSSKTIVNDQMPSPNKEIYTKTYSMASKHPGMVTPIVITVLVVPMFAVLGYMAIKRGREAWKNRHYKRMDFLLDGMYND